MGFRGHLFFGYSSVFLVAPFVMMFSPFKTVSGFFLWFSVFLLVGSLLPDIDLGYAKLNSLTKKIQYYVGGGALLAGLLILLLQVIEYGFPPPWHDLYFYVVIIPMFIVVCRISPHRTLTHSLLFLGMLTGIGLFLNNRGILSMVTFSAFIWGSFVHIYLDCGTEMGVQWFFPYPKYMGIVFYKILNLIFITFIVLSAIYFFLNGFTFYNIGTLVNSIRNIFVR